MGYIWVERIRQFMLDVVDQNNQNEKSNSSQEEVFSLIVLNNIEQRLKIFV